MPRPSVSRPPATRFTEAACLANIAGLRSGPMLIMVASRGPRGHRGRRAEGDERVDAVVDQPVEHGERAEWPGIGPPRPLQQQLAGHAGSGGGKPDADPHAKSLQRSDVLCIDLSDGGERRVRAAGPGAHAVRRAPRTEDAPGVVGRPGDAARRVRLLTGRRPDRAGQNGPPWTAGPPPQWPAGLLHADRARAGHPGRGRTAGSSRSGRTTQASATWTVLWQAIPEDRRQAREWLVRRLRFAGFGSLQDGTWLAPRDREREGSRALVAELDVAEYVGVPARPARRAAGFPHGAGPGVAPARAGRALPGVRRRVRRLRPGRARRPGRPDPANPAGPPVPPVPDARPGAATDLVAPPPGRADAVALFHDRYPALELPARRYFDHLVHEGGQS